MNYKLIYIIITILVIVLLAPSVSLLVENDFGQVSAQSIDKEKAAKGLVISGLLVLVLENAFGGSENESNSSNPEVKNETNDDFSGDDKVYWLAKAIHGEARGEPFNGKVAVGAVILNRVKSSEFPDTIYSVIYQKGQFSAVKDGQIDLEPDQEAYQAAREALSGSDPSKAALYFYNPVIAKTLWWLTTRETTTEIGGHVFAR
ncbi:MAG: cell wall hydrolase [Bacillota bacterium]